MRIFYFTKNMLQLVSVALPLELGALHALLLMSEAGQFHSRISRILY
jgi:hypothetical protein